MSFLAKTLFVGVALSAFTMLWSQEDIQRTERVINVFPSHITSTSWENISGLYSQDYDAYALYQMFESKGSALLRSEDLPTSNTEGAVPDNTVSPGESVPPGGEQEAAGGDPVEDAVDTYPDDAAAPSESIEPSVSDESIDTSAPESPEAVAPEESVSLFSQPLWYAGDPVSSLLSRIVKPMPLAIAESSEEVEIVSEGESIEVTEVSAATEFTADHSVENIAEEAGSSVSTQPDGAESTSQEFSDEVHVPESEEVHTDMVHASVDSGVLFEGFAIPALGSGERLKDAQMRVSLGAKLKRGAADIDQSVLVEYMLSGQWNEAGIIPITDEVSNALNGGYFLFALPAAEDVAVFDDLQVRITYRGDRTALEGLYLDSVWLELNVLTLDEASLRERVSSEVLPLKKPELHELLSTEIDFTSAQLPQFVLKYHEQRNAIIRFLRSIFAERIADVVHVSLHHRDYGDVGVTPEVYMTDDGLWTIRIPESARERLKPGRYALTLEVNEGDISFADTFEFQWGLLAVNTHQSEYRVGDQANISLGALSPTGNTICDAELLLYIIEPGGFIRSLPVTPSDACNGNTVIDVPDYTASYETHATGTHTIYVEMLDSNGRVTTHTEDTFEVVWDAPISIARSGPTRIYPVAPYAMTLTVSAQDAFVGELVERVPLEYKIIETDAALSVSGGEQLLTWPVSFNAAGSHSFTYEFDAPDISPYLYTLGPATVEVADGFEQYAPRVYTPPPEETPLMTPTLPQAQEKILESDGGSIGIQPDAASEQVETESTEPADGSQASVGDDVQIDEGSVEIEDVPTVDNELPNQDGEVPLSEPEIQPLMQAVYEEGSIGTTDAYTFDTPEQLSAEGVSNREDSIKHRVESFVEKRKWQIASDATGSMVVFWTDGSTIPSGWTCLSCTATGTFYQQFVRGGATYGSSGGASTTSHTASGTVYTSSSANGESQSGTEVSNKTHTHTITPDIASTSTLPAYRQLRVIQYNSAGEPPIIPAGAIMLFDGTPPSGWEEYTLQTGYYARGENTVGSTGGSNTHRHAATGTTNAADASNLDSRSGVPQSTAADAGHTHTLSTTTDAVSNEPSHIEVIFATSSSATTTPVGTLAMWTDTPPAGWVNRSAQSGDPFYERFLKAASSYGDTGGSDTHTHGDILSAVSSAPSATDNARSGSDGSSGTHTHLVDVTDISTQSHLPPYISVIVARNFGADPLFSQSAFKWYVNTNAEPPTDPWPSGATNLGENEPITATTTPVTSGSVLRLRLGISVENATSSAELFKLQFASTTSSCDAIVSWTDVGSPTSTTEWRGYNNLGVSDGATISSSTLSGTDRQETYEESNPSATMPTNILPGEAGEWDYVLQHNGAYPGATYCFRAVESDDTAFFAYTVYPRVYTNDDPAEPTLATPFDNEKTSTTSPLFTFNTSDAEANSLTYQIQISDDHSFTTIDVDRNSETHDSQFDNLTSPSDKDPFNNGELIQFHLTSALTNGTTYYWRVRARDPDGSNSWGSWSTIRSFTPDLSLTASAWFQTTEEQFDTNTLVGVDALAADTIELITGSTTGTTTSSEINFNWGAEGTSWGSLEFTDTETSGSITYQVQYEVSDDTWALVPDAVLPGNSTGFGTSPVILTGLNIDTYDVIRVLARFTNSGGSPTLSDWTVNWGYQIEPPETTMLFPNEKTGTTTPTFEFTGTDPQDDDLVYEIQWSTTTTFTASTTRISSSSLGFANITNQIDTSPFYSGDTIQFTVQGSDALTNNTTYWWRVRAVDPDGEQVYSDYTDPESFTVDTGVTVSTWFQTTAEQFNTDILSGATSSVSGGYVTVATSAVRSLIGYAEGTVQTPQYRIWDGTLWSDESSAQSVGASINWIVVKAGETREEYVLGTLGTDGDVNVQVYENGAWGNLQEVTNSISSINARGFDVAYETSSGDAVVVYCDGDADPAYYVWNGTSWTSGGTIDVSSTNNCAWIKLISNPTSDEIIMVERDNVGSFYEAQVWNGSAWGNAVTWGTMSESGHEGIAAAYEESGNQAVVAVSNGTSGTGKNFSWRAWNGSSWTAAATQALGADFEQGSLVADVGSDNMALCYVDDDNDIGAVRWTGSAWTGQTELEASGLTKDDRPFDCIFEVGGSRDGYIMVAYSDATNVRYTFWNGTTWATEASVDTIQDAATVQLRRTGAGILQLTAFDSTNDRYDTAYWNGSAWSTFETLESDASVGASPFKEPFMIAPRNPGTTATVLGDPGIDFYDGSGPYWQQMSWTDTESGGSSILYQVEYYNTASSSWALVPNSLIPGNASGTTTSPISLTGVLPVATYNMLRPVANMSCNLGTCPTLSDWTLTWAEGITVSGTAQAYDQSTNLTSGTVAIALNGTLQVGKTGTISGGSWSISNVNAAPGDVVTVFIQGAADSGEAVSVTTYDGVGNMDGITLFERHLSIGSNDFATTTNAHIGLYDFTHTEDIFVDVDAGNDLAVCATTGCGDAEIYIAAGNRYQPGSGGDIATHDLENNGTFLPNGNTIRVSGSWDNNATATMATSTLIFTATSTTESLDDTGAVSVSYYNLTFGETSGSATWTLAGNLDIDGALTVAYGTLDRGTRSLVLAGNLVNGAGGLWSGIGTTTFDGSTAATWTDNASTKQDIGYVVVNGTSKTLTLGSNVRGHTITIESDDILDASNTGYDITVLSHWTNNNTFTARTGEVIFAATTTNVVIAQGNSNFYDLTFNGGGGSWSFTGANVTASNDFTVATGTVTLPTGTTTVAGSWNSTGGLFAHNNSGVAFTSAGAETITLAGGAFTNTFYNLTFSGNGSWSFVSQNATTSNHMRVSGGTVTFPSGVFALGGSLIRSGGTIAANNGTLQLTSSAAQTLQTGGSSLASLFFTGSGSWSFVDSSLTATGNVTIANGAVTLPTGTMTVGGSWSNGASFSHSSGTVLFNSSATGRTIDPGSSAFYNLTFNNAAGGWTVSADATTTNATTLTAALDFTLATGTTLSVGGTFTNSVGGTSTTWSGTLALVSTTSYALNTKTNTGDVYGTLRIGSSTHVSAWNSSATSYDIVSGGSLYSQDHNATDGDLYIFGTYGRTSGTEHWSYGTDFDGTVLTATSSRQVDVRFSSGASGSFAGAALSIVGTSSATTTIGAQSGTYTVFVGGGTFTASHFTFADLGLSGVTLASSTSVSSFSDGAFMPGVDTGTGLTLSSTTIDANQELQIYRIEFATTTAITATNVSQTDGTPVSYWWFRESSGNLDGEGFDNDTGDPGSVRWDDSNLVISVSGTVYSDDGVTPMGNPTCDDTTPVVKVVVDGAASSTAPCASANGTFTVPGVVVVGDPILTVYLDTNGGAQAVAVTKTPTGDIAGLNLYQNRLITRHEDTEALTIANLAVFDETDDSDIPFVAATGSPHTLTVRPDTELHIASSTTFAPGGNITLQSGGSGAAYDGSLHLAPYATMTAAGTEAYTIGGGISVDQGALFSSASTTVTLTATTTGKSITTPAGQTIAFNNLSFTGVGGGWSVDGDISVSGDLSMATGTLTGTEDITVSYGSFSGNGTVQLTGGTTTIARTNTLGGATPWTFYNLSLGNGSVAGTTTPPSATTTIAGVFTIANAHLLNAGSSEWNLTGTGTPFIVSGTFDYDTSLIRYSASGAANITSANYYDLDLNASSGSPTYTAIGLGIQVFNTLMIGGDAATAFDLTTNDPALNVDGDVVVRSNGTLVGSNSSSFTVAGDWDMDGTFTASGGTVTFDGALAATVAAGASPFASVTVNKTSSLSIVEHATATGAFTLAAATGFTVESGVSLAVGTTFTNSVGGAATTWAGSTLYLYGGSNYQINASTTNDTYGTLLVGSGTDIRMWNSSAASVTVDPTGSLYSQDHAAVDGALYIYGDYVKSSGSDYWSYATDFDGTALGGSSRAVTVSFAPNATATISGGTLAMVGAAGASTTITNQGSGAYALVVNAGTLSAQYYVVRNINAQGLVITNAPTVTTLSYGDFEISQNNGSGITVGGTAINQNPAKTFTHNVFATSSGITVAYNVTATGTAVSSWRFTNHSGALAGESFDSDPDGDPGYVVWDDSAAQITISGTVYSDEGSTPIGGPTCDGTTPTVRIRVAGLTDYTGSCTAASSTYSIGGISYSPGDSIVAYLDTGGGAQAAVVTVDPVSSIANMDLYQNRVIVRHENTDPLTIDDMSLWDSSDDADIPFTAVSNSPDTLTLPSDRKLIVWSGKTFAPGGNVTLSGGGVGDAVDGTLELYSNAVFTAAGTEAHSIGGHLVTASGASITGASATFTFTSAASARTIDTNNGTLYNLTFNGSGSWTITDTNTTVSNNVTITQGSVTMPAGTTTVGGSFLNTGGSFSHASGTTYFTATAGGKSVQPGASSFYRLVFNGTGGAWSFVGSTATATKEFLVNAGTVTLPSGTLTVAGPFNVLGGAIVHNSGTVSLTATTSATALFVNGSTLHSVAFAGTGSYVMQDANPTLLGSLTITQGAVTLATGTLSIAGSFTNTGGSFEHASGTVLFNSSDTGESINPGGSPFYAVSLASASGGWTISGSATTSDNFSLTSASQFTLASGTRLTVYGVFTNTVGGATTTWSGSTLDIESATTYTINTSSAGGDQYDTLVIGPNADIRMWNSAATTTTVDASSSLYSQDHAAVNGSLYLYGHYVRSSGSDYWSYATDFDGTALGGSSRAVTVSFAPNATATYSGATLAIVGSTGATTTVTNQGSGTYALGIDGGTINAQYYAFRNGNEDGLTLSGLTTVSSLAYGDFELATSGGSLLTVSSTTVNGNASLTITGVRFATTTAITGTNVAVVGTTPNSWTFTSHTGNLDGEAYDSDGIDDCGSIRWDDSTCLITEQTHFRWRNDDGGEGVPSSEWYDGSWSKRRRVALANSDATGYVNAAIELSIPFDGDMQSDFDDLRFTSSDGTTLLSHWREVYTASTEATVWVEVPLLATSSVTSIYMYYGNGGASDASASTTFIFLDDFEDGGISEYSGDTGEFSVSGSSAYERTYRLVASDPDGGKTDLGGMYNNSYAVAQGQMLRYLQYVDATQASDESCTTFGTQSQTQNYGVCLELNGVDRMSLVRDVLHRDTSGTVLSSTTVSYSTGWYEVEIAWNTDDSMFVSLYQNDSLVATTSATDSTYSSGGVGYTLWTQHGAWDAYHSRPLLANEPTVTISVEQVSGGASWSAAQDTALSGVALDENQRLRFVIENGGLEITNQQFRLEYAPKGVAPSCESVSYGSYNPVPNDASCGSSPICMTSSSHYVDQASTTDLLATESAFTYGKIVEDPSNKTDALTVPSNYFTEVEYALIATSNATDTAYCLRVTNDGTDLDSYAKVAELGMRFDPTVNSWSLNNSESISLLPGTTTTIYATGTVSDSNGYADLLYATSTIYRSGVGPQCSADNNNCYQIGSTSCAFSNCSGNSCDISCSADIYFFADPTDDGAYVAQDWRADLLVSDQGGGYDTQSTIGSELVTLRAIDVDDDISYGSLAVSEDTGAYNATTTVQNIGNDAIDVELSGTDLSDGTASLIPVAQQKYATSTFTYSSCTICTLLTAVSTSYEIDLSKPTSTTPVLSDDIYWGISIPFGTSALPHEGTNTFIATGD